MLFRSNHGNPVNHHGNRPETVKLAAFMPKDGLEPAICWKKLAPTS